MIGILHPAKCGGTTLNDYFRDQPGYKVQPNNSTAHKTTSEMMLNSGCSRVIMLVRHPVERLISRYKWVCGYGRTIGIDNPNEKISKIQMSQGHFMTTTLSSLKNWKPLQWYLGGLDVADERLMYVRTKHMETDLKTWGVHIKQLPHYHNAEKVDFSLGDEYYDKIKTRVSREFEFFLNVCSIIERQ